MTLIIGTGKLLFLQALDFRTSSLLSDQEHEWGMIGGKTIYAIWSTPYFAGRPARSSMRSGARFRRATTGEPILQG